jgi:hypothetical protein
MRITRRFRAWMHAHPKGAPVALTLVGFVALYAIEITAALLIH